MRKIRVFLSGMAVFFVLSANTVMAQNADRYTHMSVGSKVLLNGDETDFKLISDIFRGHRESVAETMKLWSRTYQCTPNSHLLISLNEHGFLSLKTEITCKK